MYNTHSINDRLKNIAKEKGFKDVERVRVILCLERIIARLMQNSYLHDHLIFGGGFVLYKNADSHRFTKDVDAIISVIDDKKLVKLVKESLKRV